MRYVRRSIWSLWVSWFLFLLAGGTAHAESTLTAKVGSYALLETTQIVPGPPSAVVYFDEDSTQAFGLEYGWRFKSGFSVGAEITDFSHDWTSSVGTSGHLRSSTLTVNGKKYFDVTNWFQPYVAVGLGFATGDFVGPGGSAGLFGFAGQVMGGIEFRLKHVGFYTEYKWLTAKPEDSGSEKIDITGSALYAGLSVHF